jgi:hypothetical protein
MNRRRIAAASAAAVAVLVPCGLFLTAGAGSAAAAPAPPAPQTTVESWQSPAWFATARAVQVQTTTAAFNQGASNHSACIADVSVSPAGVSITKDAPGAAATGQVPVLLPWASVNQLTQLSAAQADAIGCP